MSKTDSKRARFFAAMWQTRYLGPEDGDAGWFAFERLFPEPTFEDIKETGLYETEDEATAVALETWPEEFGE